MLLYQGNFHTTRPPSQETWTVNCITCQEENSEEQMADKMKDVMLEGSHAGRHVSSVQCVIFNHFLVNSGAKRVPHCKATHHEHRCERRIKFWCKKGKTGIFKLFKGYVSLLMWFYVRGASVEVSWICQVLRIIKGCFMSSVTCLLPSCHCWLWGSSQWQMASSEKRKGWGREVMVELAKPTESFPLTERN